MAVPRTDHHRDGTKSRRTDFVSEVDQFDKDTWHQIIQCFDDAHLCQTWSYGAARWGEDNLSHLVLRRNGEIVAAAQVLIIKFPVVGAGIGFVKWGPMWQLRGRQKDPEVCRHMLRALCQHYATRRRLLLRLMPAEIDDDIGTMRSLLESEGLIWRRGFPAVEHWRIDLSRSTEELRKILKRNWRYYLTRGQKHNLDITELKGTEALEVFLNLYRQMQDRKSFVDFSDINYFREFQADLPEPLKLKVLACQCRGEPVAAVALSIMGDTGLAVFGATGDKGLMVGASYVLDWRVVNWLKEQGCHWYDLGGAGDPGVSRYKSGLVGKNGKVVRFIGKFDSCRSLPSLVTVRLADSLRDAYRNVLASDPAMISWRRGRPRR